MSLSFLELRPRAVRYATGCVLALSAGSSFAAETYLVPGVEAGAEYHSDLGLQAGAESEEEDSTEGYFANVWAVAGVRSPRAFVEVKPRVRFQEYPDREDLQKSNEYFNLRSGYETLRSSLSVTGSYQNEDEVRAEIADAEFDDVDPDDPVADETGQIESLSGQRTRIQLRPEFTYQLSQRVGVGTAAVFQTVDYDYVGDTRLDYDYGRADAFLSWSLSPRTSFRTGAFATLFETDNGFSKSDSTGVALGLEHQLSETFRATASVEVERVDLERADLAMEDSSTNTGFTVGIYRRDVFSQWRVSAGRTYNPTGVGARSEFDQIRVEYDRNLTERLSLFAAVRGYRSRPQVVSGTSNNDEDFFRTDIGWGWNMTRTLSVTGGYAYIQRQFEGERGDRSDNVVMLSIRYQGLPPQGLQPPP